MTELLQGGRIVDAIFVVLVFELLIFAGAAWAGRPRAAEMIWTILSGAGLVLALRAVVAGAEWSVVLLCLSAAGVAHGLDLWARLRRRGV